MANETANRRSIKNALSSPSEQLQAGLTMFLYGFAINCVFVAIIAMLCSSALSNLVSMVPAQFEAETVVNEMKSMLWVTFGLFVIALALTSALLGIKITHRYLGPLQNARRFVRSMIDGKPQGLMVLREGDKFELAEDLNQLARKIYPDLH